MTTAPLGGPPCRPILMASATASRKIQTRENGNRQIKLPGPSAVQVAATVDCPIKMPSNRPIETISKSSFPTFGSTKTARSH